MDISITNGDSSSLWRSPSSLSNSSRNEMRTDASRNNSSASNEHSSIVPTSLAIGSAKIAKPLHLQRLEAALDLTLLMRQVQSFIGPNVKLPNPNDSKQATSADSTSNRSMSPSDLPLKPSLKSIKAKSYNISKVKKSKRWIKNVILDGQLSSDDEDEEAMFKTMTASGLSRASLTKEGKRKKKKEDDMVNDMIKFNNFSRKFKKELEEKKIGLQTGLLEGPLIPKKYERYSLGVMNNSYIDQPLNPVKKEKKEKVVKDEQQSQQQQQSEVDNIISEPVGSSKKGPKKDLLMDVSKIKQEKVDIFPPIDMFNVTQSMTSISSVPITTTTALLDDIPYDAFLPDEILESESIESNEHPMLSQGSMASTWDLMANVKIEVKPETKSDVDSIPSSPTTSIPHFKHMETSTGHSLSKGKKIGKCIDDIFETGSSLLDILSPSQRIDEFDDEDSSSHSGSQNSSLVSQTMSQPPLRSISMATVPRVASATVSRPCSRLSSSQPDPMPSYKSLTAPPTPTGLTSGLSMAMKRPSSGQKSEGCSPKKKKKRAGVEVMMERRKRLWSVITKRDVPRAWTQMKALQEKFLTNRKLLSDSFVGAKGNLKPSSTASVVEPNKLTGSKIKDHLFEVDNKCSIKPPLAMVPKIENRSNNVEMEVAQVLKSIVEKVAKDVIVPVCETENRAIDTSELEMCVTECLNELLFVVESKNVN